MKAPENHIFFVVGQNCWGRHIDLKTAIENARVCAPAKLRKRGKFEHLIYLLPTDAAEETWGASEDHSHGLPWVSDWGTVGWWKHPNHNGEECPACITNPELETI